MSRSAWHGKTSKAQAKKKQTSYAYMQRAELLIKENQTAAAHRLLLSHARAQFRNPQLWLMLAKTAPNPSAAHEYYHICSLLEPSNTQAIAGLASTRTYAQDVSHLPEYLIPTQTFIHTASYPSSPARQGWFQRLLKLLKGDQPQPK